MIDAHEFRELISGRRRGVRAALWRSAFAAAEWPYRFAVGWRNHSYDRGRSPVKRVNVPVVSVGNLTVGGTGKTPMVEWLARWYRQRDVRVALVSRGYGAAAGQRNDEALELEEKLPDVPHLQNADRVAAAITAIEEFESQLILLDDAFQHRRIHRDLDIVLLDALDPFGLDHLLPRGLLREPVSSLRRANVIALTRADAVDESRRAEIRRRALASGSDALWIEVVHQPAALRSAAGCEEPLDWIAGRPLVAFCGIGNPAGFRHSLQTCGYELTGFREFADHHAYTRGDLESLGTWAAEHAAAALVCTHKDLVKVGAESVGGIPVWALRIGMQVRVGGEAFDRRLEETLVR